VTVISAAKRPEGFLQSVRVLRSNLRDGEATRNWQKRPEGFCKASESCVPTFGTVNNRQVNREIGQMNYAVLSEVAKIIMGQSPPSSTYNTKGEGLPFFQGKADFGDLYPTPRVFCSEPNRIAEPEDILITVRAPVGPTNLNRERSCIGCGLAAIRVGDNLDRDYLLYFLRFYEPTLAKAGTGSTFTAISRDDLETVKIPLPPLTEQRRIAARLAKADHLRRLRRYAEQLSETTLQSVFVEMFGYPRTNTKKWEIGLFLNRTIT
jgi:type I restriction enzyme S subunit